MRPVPAQVILACLACAGCRHDEDFCQQADKNYPNQCIDRTTVWQAIALHDGHQDASLSDGGIADDGGIPSGCPTDHQLLGAEVYPRDLGLEGALFSAPTLHPETDTCCYTTFPRPCK